MDTIDDTNQELVGGTYNGSISGNLQLIDGVVGKAAYFDGSTTVDFGTDRDSCFNFPELCSNGFTMAFWIKKPVTTREVYYISNGGQTQSSYGYFVCAKDHNKLRLGFKTTSMWFMTSISIEVSPHHCHPYLILVL